MRNPSSFKTVGISRREWLRLLLPIAALVPAPWLLAATSRSANQIPAMTLGSFLDTLLPGDEASPSATYLQVHQAIISESRGNEYRERLLPAGCAWLNRQAGAANFESLDEPRRIQIVTAAEQAASGTLPRVFFENVRYNAFRHYYSNPGAWQALKYPGPPQPEGFLDFDRKPAGD